MTYLTKLNLVSVAVLASISMSSMAHEIDLSSFYVSAKIGQAKTDIDSTQIMQRFNEGTSGTQLLGFDDSDTAGGIALGYEATDWLSLEFGYTELGERSLDYIGVPDTATFYQAVAQVYPNSANGLTYALLAHWELNQYLSVGAKVGGFKWRGEFNTFNSTTSTGQYYTSGNSLWFGAEATYQLNETWQIYVTAERYNVNPDDVDLVGLGVRFYFDD